MDCIKTLNQKEQRLGKEKYNNQGCLMKIIVYNSATDIFVEFQDKYKCQINCEYKQFKNGNLVNPYFPNVFNKGMIGNKYSCRENNKDCKEYIIWHSMLSRCYSNYTKSANCIIKCERKRKPPDALFFYPETQKSPDAAIL